MPEPFFTSSACVASKYGSEKSSTFARSSVIVMPAAAASHSPVFRSCPLWMPSNGVLTIFCCRPSSLATRSMMSTSKPTTWPPWLNWNGL
jgi:hypothetical protein